MLGSLSHRVGFCSVLLASHAAAEPGAFHVEGDPFAWVQGREHFPRLARSVAADADARLKTTNDVAEQKLLLALRVHLALHLREDELALQLAEQIRASLADPGERAHSGLTTRAIVESQRDPVRFERDF